MRLLVLAVGAPRHRNVAEAISEYRTRAERYFRLETAEVSSGAGPGRRPSDVRTREAERLGKQIPAGFDTWALTRGGEEISSRDLADTLSDLATYGSPGVAILVGGAFGLSEDLLRKCTRRISLSRLTLPHDLARLVLLEQLYRAGTIIRGEPYHKVGGQG